LSENVVDVGQLVLQRVVLFDESTIPFGLIRCGAYLLTEFFGDIKQKFGWERLAGAWEVMDHGL